MCLGPRGDRRADTLFEVVAALNPVTDRHPVHRRDPGCACAATPLARIDGLGMVRGQPASGLGHVDADIAPNVRSQRRGVMPALQEVSPNCWHAKKGWRVIEPWAYRRLTVPQLGDGPLQRIDHGRMPPGRGGVRVETRERFRGQVFQPWTAVDQQRLRQDSGKPVTAVLAGLAAVTPALRESGDRYHRRGDGLFAEDKVRQVKPVEVSQVLVFGEPAQREGQGQQERAHRYLGRQRLGGAEGLTAGTGQSGPIPGGPSPPGPAQRGAVVQNDRRGMKSCPFETRVFVVMQPSAGRIQRPDQPRQRLPRRGRAPWNSHGSVALQRPRTQRSQSFGLAWQ